MDSPFFTVVIPTYNRRKLLERAVRSVELQSFKNWELIIVDNNSDDGTHEYLETLEDPRIRVFSIFNNGVIAKSRNKGIENARGEWIAFLDSDDVFESSKLEIAYDSVLGSECGFFYHSIKYEKEGSSEYKYYHALKLDHNAYRHLLTKGAPFATSSVMVRHEVLKLAGGFTEDTNCIASEDYDLWLRIAKTQLKFCFSRKVLGVNRIGVDNMSARDMSLPLKAVLDKHEEELQKVGRVYKELVLLWYRTRFEYGSGGNNYFLRFVKKGVLGFGVKEMCIFLTTFLLPKMVDEFTRKVQRFSV